MENKRLMSNKSLSSVTGYFDGHRFLLSLVFRNHQDGRLCSAKLDIFLVTLMQWLCKLKFSDKSGAKATMDNGKVRQGLATPSCLQGSKDEFRWVLSFGPTTKPVKF